MMKKYFNPLWRLLTNQWFIVVVMAVGMQFLEYSGLFANAEGFALNAFLRAPWHDSTDATIITIGINEGEAEALFGEAPPLAPDAVQSLVAAIQQKSPAVIGVDLLTDRDGYEKSEPQRPWSTEMPPTNSGEASRIVWAAGAREPQLEYAGFFARLFSLDHDHLFATPGKVLNKDPAGLGFSWGLAVYVYDDDGVVRRLPRLWHVDAERAFENTFARQVARAYCAATDDVSCEHRPEALEVFLPFDETRLRENHYSVGKLFTCTKVESRVCTQWEFRGNETLGSALDWPKTIVLLGGDYPDMNDWHRTPIDERTAGLLVNASAVQAELSGPRLERFSHLMGFALDLVFGGLIVAIFTLPRSSNASLETGQSDVSKPQPPSLRTRILVCLLLAPLAIVLGAGLFWLTETLWVSWVGMLMTSLAWHIVLEVMHHDPAHGAGSHPVKT